MFNIRNAVPVVFAAVSLIFFFFPIYNFTFGNRLYRFSGFKIVFTDISVKDIIISLPAIARIFAAFYFLLIIASMVSYFLKKIKLSGFIAALSAVSIIAVSVTVGGVAGKLKTIGIASPILQTAPAFYILIFSAVLLSVSLFWILNGEKLAQSVFLVCSCISIASVVLITVYMLISGLPAIKEIGLYNFIFGKTWAPANSANPQFGILPMILTSIAMTFGAILIGVPIGILTAVYLSELSNKRTAKIIRPAVDLLAGIPSVIFGFFGMTIIVPAIKHIFNPTGQKQGIFGFSLLAAIIILSIMILPTIIRTADTGLQSVPSSYREASLAIGATPITTIFKVVIPAAKSPILSGVILGVGRAVGETMAVIMVAGNAVQMPSLLKACRPLTVGIVMEMSYASGLHREALFAIGLVLFVFIMLINLAFTWISKQGVQMDAK